MKETIDTEKQIQAIKRMIVNTTVNNYAVERVAFGYEKPGDQAPIDLYLEHLPRLVNFYTPDMRKDIPGEYIDEHERIKADRRYYEFVRDLFILQMEKIFFDAPKDINLERAAEDIPLLPRFREHVIGLFPLFIQIMRVEVEYDVFDVIPTNKTERAAEYNQWVKFVTAILLKPLKCGSRINRYVNFTNAPHYVRALIEKKGNNFYLKNSDTKSHEYIFALFSLMQFMNEENGKLLELKMFEWKRRNSISCRSLHKLRWDSSATNRRL